MIFNAARPILPKPLIATFATIHLSCSKLRLVRAATFAAELQLFLLDGKTCFEPGVKSTHERMDVIPAMFFKYQRRPGA